MHGPLNVKSVQIYIVCKCNTIYHKYVQNEHSG